MFKVPYHGLTFHTILWDADDLFTEKQLDQVKELRDFKNRILRALEKKTSWGRVEFAIEIEKCYTETLENLVGPKLDFNR